MTPAQKKACNFVISSPFAKPSKKELSELMKKQGKVRQGIEARLDAIKLEKELKS